MACYFVGFLFLAWVALTVHIVNPTSMGSGPTLMDIFINQAKRMFSRPKKSTEAAATSVHESNSAATSAESLDIEKAGQMETRLDVFSKGLERKDPVTIRVEGLGMSVSLTKLEWNLSGLWRYIRQETTEKQLLRDVDVVFPAGELTAILGGSGAGKVCLCYAPGSSIYLFETDLSLLIRCLPVRINVECHRRVF
jgi:ABC-type multidrug transport system fused ATPase/permease subunit